MKQLFKSLNNKPLIGLIVSFTCIVLILLAVLFSSSCSTEHKKEIIGTKNINNSLEKKLERYESFMIEGDSPLKTDFSKRSFFADYTSGQEIYPILMDKPLIQTNSMRDKLLSFVYEDTLNTSKNYTKRFLIFMTRDSVITEISEELYNPANERIYQMVNKFRIIKQ